MRNVLVKVRASVVMVAVGTSACLALTGTAKSTSAATAESEATSNLRVRNIPSKWTAEWWQWAFAIPADRNPLQDETGEFCAEEQSNNVWRLGGVFGGSATGIVRQCTIPASKKILLPILNVVCLELDGDKQAFGSLEGCLDFVVPNILEDSLTLKIVDETGQEYDLSNEIKQVRSPLFEITLPEDNIKELAPPIEPNPSDAMSGGYWAMFKLPPGEYTVSIAGAFDPDFFPFALDVTYELTMTR